MESTFGKDLHHGHQSQQTEQQRYPVPRKEQETFLVEVGIVPGNPRSEEEGGENRRADGYACQPGIMLYPPGEQYTVSLHGQQAEGA